MNESPVLTKMIVHQDIGTYEPCHFVMRLHFHEDGSVTWDSIPLDELEWNKVTFDPEMGRLAAGTGKSRFF